MTLIVAVVACVVALVAFVLAVVISRRVRDVEVHTLARGEQETQQWKAALDKLRADQARQLTDIASNLGKRIDSIERFLDDLHQHGEATGARTASAIDTLAGQVAEVGERTRDNLVQLHADVMAQKESTIAEVVDLLRHQTDSLRNDLVARLAEGHASDQAV